MFVRNVTVKPQMSRSTKRVADDLCPLTTTPALGRHTRACTARVPQHLYTDGTHVQVQPAHHNTCTQPAHMCMYFPLTTTPAHGRHTCACRALKDNVRHYGLIYVNFVEIIKLVVSSQKDIVFCAAG